jgi:hypothetical protein
VTRAGLLAVALVIVAACGDKKATPTGQAPARDGLTAVALDPAGPAFAGLVIDAPAGAQVTPASRAAIITSDRAKVEVDLDPPLMAGIKQEYLTAAAAVQATLQVSEESDDLLVYSISRGPVTEHGVDLRVPVGGKIYRCFLKQSTRDPAVRDLVHRICTTLRAAPPPR